MHLQDILPNVAKQLSARPFSKGWPWSIRNAIDRFVVVGLVHARLTGSEALRIRLDLLRLPTK